ncbi:SRPBCC family protein [Streptomyces sp. NPDC056835]|uniref:SRPBCC family protein n=1 Tax=Streptomyces sp. NPDC056835 TaxID=3345956 RepID=UPI003691EEE2
MTKTDERPKADATSPLEELRTELGNYVGARAQRMVGSAVGKLTDLASSPNGSGPGAGGGMLAIGKRVLGGESPVKAFLAENFKGAKDKVVSGVKEALGGGGGKAGDTKVTNIVEVIDIGLPLRSVYDQWTQFEDFSSFTKGVRGVDMSDEIESDWKLKVGPSSRSWKATVQEQVPDERIVWTSEGAKGTTRGAVSFHELTPDLTRVVVVVEYYPSGFFEKTGNIWRAQGRRLRLDLKHFQRYVTLTDEDAEGWRGEIRDGEVVRSHEEALEEEEEERAAEEEEEPEGELEEDYDDEEKEEESEEEEAGSRSG